MSRLDGFLTPREKEGRNRAFDTGRIYMAEVMDTRNATSAGEIKVWILNSGIDRNNKDKWVIASYCSPFFGTTPYKLNASISDGNNPRSFGAWFPMPCVGNFVFIFYACMAGENIEPFWFGCPVDGDINYMLPGMPSSFYDKSKGILGEINNKNGNENVTSEGEITSITVDDKNITLLQREEIQPELKYMSEAIRKQGLANDRLRGYSTAGSKRETPSMCYGFLTPMGNSFTMDDGWAENDNKQHWNMDDGDKLNPQDIDVFRDLEAKRFDAGFRLRTRNGAQLLISDYGTIYAINSQGTAWSEISEDGRVQTYAQNSLDASCDGDINLHSKAKIIMEADEGFALKSSKGGLSIDLAGDINISSPHIKTDSIVTMPEVNATMGNIETFQSSMAQVNGIFGGTLQGTAYYATSSGPIPSPQPTPKTNAPEIPNPLLEEEKQISGMNGMVQVSINTNVPTHEPYDGHNCNERYPNLDVTRKTTSYGGKQTFIPTVTNQVQCEKQPANDSDYGAEDSSIPDVQLTPNYKLQDVCYSNTATRLGINNVPNDEGIEKLRLVAQNILEPVSEKFGKKARVNSGYRGPQLNRAVGGASSSQHCKCEAVDLEVDGVSNYDLAVWIRDNLDFDQVILEEANNLAVDPNSGWVHCSYKASGNRHSVLTIKKSGQRAFQGLIK